MDHPIFHTPFQVEPTLVDQPTPPSYARYAGGKDLGASMPMWRVQTEGYSDGNDQLIGMVSRDAGFLDSPDTEWISGGVNSKGPNAVAIGRHGNFFHWGFAGSPTFMTDEAKLVLVNALHYIADFDGQVPIARKRQGVILRQAIDSMLHGISDEGYAETVALYKELGADVPGRFRSVRRSFPNLAVEGSADSVEDVSAALQGVRPYVYHTDGWYTFEVDEEARALGISNADPAILDRAIALFATEGGATLGQTLLTRYTRESFATPAEWRTWRAANRDRTFFTEAGGYKWLVNTIADDAASAASLDSANAVEANSDRHGDLAPTGRNPVDWKAEVRERSVGGLEVIVRVAIFDGWHAYRDVPKGSPYVPLSFELDLPEGLAVDGDWTLPAARPDPHDPTVQLWEGELTFRRALRGELPAGGEVSCKASYQVCDERMCLPPTTGTQEASLPEPTRGTTGSSLDRAAAEGR